MSAQPTVTVCIPTFNRRRLLEASLQSVLDQSFGDFEVIVSDNASVDGTGDYVRKVAEGDPRVRYDRLDENIGLFGNLSRALHVGTGRYRVMLPDDDLMLPGNLKRKVELLDAHPEVGLVHSGFRYLDGDARPTGEAQNWTRLTGDTIERGRDFIRRSISYGGVVCVSSVMTRAEQVADEMFDADDGPYADIALWLRIANRSDVGFLVDPLSGYLVHNGSASSGFQLVKVTGSKNRMSTSHADATLQAHGRFVQRAPLAEQDRAELAELLRQADRRMRMAILANAYVPAPLLATLKRAAGWRPGGLMHSKLSLDGNTGPVQAEGTTSH